MKKVLVTGGAGFIGSALVRWLLSHTDVQILNIDKLTYAGHLESLSEVSDNKAHHFLREDINNREGIRAAFKNFQPDGVIHLAAETHVDRSLESPIGFVHSNVAGTCNLLEESLLYWNALPSHRQAAFRLLHVSTDEVFGNAEAKVKFDSQSKYSPNSPYAASKAAADHFVRAYYISFGLPVLTVNCSNNYGPYQFPEKLIPLVILNALEGKSLPIYGNGRQIRDWIFVDDHCEALWKALQQGRVGAVYPVGGETEQTNLEVVRTICHIVDEILPSDAPSTLDLIEHVVDRPGHDRRYSIDSSNSKLELDWRPKTDFPTGIRRTVEWYRQNLEWVAAVSQDYQERQRLGLRFPAQP